MELDFRNSLKRIVGHRLCLVEPTIRGLSSITYPWKHMEPGEFFQVADTSLEARQRLAVAASIAGKRMGRKFCTGTLFEHDAAGEPVHTGWWCARVDGVEVLPPPPTEKQRRYAAKKKELADSRRLSERYRRKTRVEPVRALGTHVYKEPTGEEPPVADYSGWGKPVPPEEYL